MLLMRSWRALASPLLLLLVQCGGRTPLYGGDAGEPGTPCTTDADCVEGTACATRACIDNYCAVVAYKNCDDGVFCTTDSCNDSTGECQHQWKTSDSDKDGFYAPLPGTEPGAVDSCGDDCNDTQAAVYPGAPEVCDGFDNNCNGRTDEGAYTYSPASNPVRVTDDSVIAGGPTGLAYNGNWFALSFTGVTEARLFQGYFSSYDAWASNVVPMLNTTQTSQDSYGGPLAWTGSVYATVWEVRGESGYDIWFNQLDSRGQKMGPNVRVTDTTGFSISPCVLLNGNQHWVAWADSEDGELFRIRGRQLSSDRQIASDIVDLTELSSDARTPTLIKSPTSTLLVFVADQQVRGRILDASMNPVNDEVPISGTGVANYSADWVADRFVIAWTLEDQQPGNAVWAATLDANGALIQSARPITSGANFARTPNVLSLIDRFALAWADDRVTYGHYGIRMSAYDTTLTALTGVQTLAETEYDCIDPTLASGGLGLALVYRERTPDPRTKDNTGVPYFVGLTCDYGER